MRVVRVLQEESSGSRSVRDEGMDAGAISDNTVILIGIELTLFIVQSAKH